MKAAAARRSPRRAPRAPRAADQRLAIDGGRAVRARPLPGPYPGALLYGKPEEKQVLEVLRAKSPFRYYGPNVRGKVEAFERRLALRLSVRHALATCSGTSALKCALYAVGVEPGDDVLVPAYSYIATADVVLSLGARPVFVEVDESLTMDPADLRRKLTPRSKAVTPVHLFGVAPDMDPILTCAREANLAVVEDVAQSLGATYRGRPAGTLGAVGITSFQLNKIITAGEGGAVFTDDEAIYHRAVRLHDHGNVRGHDGGEPLIGEGFRLNELSGALLLAQLARLNDILRRLRAAKRALVKGLAGVPGLTLAAVPDPVGDAGAALIFFVRDAALCQRVVTALNAEGIRVLRQYGGKPLYGQGALPKAGVAAKGACPRTEDLVGRAVFLGLSTGFARRDLDDIVAAIRKVMKALAS